ncbi:hypothetical protein ISN44_As12g030440 [Arabidopsis suecica]|uniref:Uncharacterized protein n=1 Tax=Arabidopsis suecica TaxID=45249 RepID=A0A8T1YNK5_ARASU|nr:hypothetical protein ISN44_As12g030440 [Arabidopsis suecica]
MSGGDTLDASLAETLKAMQQTMSKISQKFSDVEKAVDTLQTSQVSLSQNVNTIQSRVRSLSAGNPIGVRRRVFNSPNGTSGQTTHDGVNTVIQLTDGETQLEDEIADQHEQESLDQFETMRNVRRELKEMRSKFYQATSSEPDINRVIEEPRRTPFIPQIASLRIRDSRKLNFEPYNGLEDPKSYLAAFLIAAGRVDLGEAEEDAGYCKLFSENLCGQALMWFTQLEPDNLSSIHMFMASSLSPFPSLNPSPLAPRFLQTLTQFPNSPFLSPCSVLKLKNASLLNLRTRIAPLQPQRVRSKTLVLSAQSSFLKVLRTAWNIGKDGIEAGTNLVPVSVPRPVARISVTIAALAVSLFVVKSFLSTAFFVLGTMGFAYFLFIALNKDEAPKVRGDDNSYGSKPMDDPLEEAKKIMDKYK